MAFTPAVRPSTRSANRAAESGTAILAPSGAVMSTRNCGVSAFGNREKPTTGTRASEATTNAAPSAKVRAGRRRDRKSTRLNSSHSQISYAVFCLKKKNNKEQHKER